MSRVIGRVTLLGEVHGLLVQGRSVALAGPPGIGLSALLDAVESALAGHDGPADPADRGETVLRASGAAAEQSLAYAVLQDLLDQVPGPLPDALAGNRLMGRQVDPAVADEDRAAVAFGVLEVLAGLATAERPVVLLLDDAHWFDAESVAALRFAVRRLTDRVRVVAAVGRGDGVDLTGFTRIDVPPLAAADTVDLLTPHGLPAHTAHRLHVESGGVPALALALAGAVAATPELLGRPTPLPASVEQVARQRFLDQPAEVRNTLGYAALLHRPTVRHLERAGRVGAEAHLRAAAAAGLVACAGDEVRFTPPTLRRIVVGLAPEVCRAELHAELAVVAPTVGERLRHRALADPRPDATLATELASAAADCVATGARELATELFVLAADRAPCELAAERTEWLATAIETGAPGNHAELVHRALRDLQESPATPAQLVRVRLALLELAGSGMAAMDEALTTALADAADDDVLVSMVLLQRARVALMESDAVVAARHAAQAVRLLRRSGSPADLAAGLTTLAVATRWTGRGDHDALIAEALALPDADPPALVHLTPAYTAARFAMYDDRLDEAWTALLRMLGRVDRGAGTDQLHLLRSLVEVAARSGRCAEAVAYAERAARIGEEFGLDPHPGWFVSALAELAGGDFGRAAALAERGASAAEERGDVRYLQRHLLVLGSARLRTGDAEGSRTALERLALMEAAGGCSDPTVHRWQPELATALVVTGRLEQAETLLDRARRALDGRPGTDGVAAQLDRAEAHLLAARGDLDGAAILLDRAEKVCRDLGLRLDEGRVLVGRAQLDRRRRRHAAARAGLEQARDHFRSLRATPWVAAVEAELGGQPAGPGDPADADPAPDGLTPTEARVAAEVARGASNREIAERLFVSVKTVESTLTRVYRKLGVRSRTQLATRVGVPAAD
ncbi:LuxR C-terminal-related transcriptional regulator [Nocardioides sp. GCM10027113]|uniref:helix-turn-helix transcriptional regulator n=1 Tax=unclassified Nocardioides TaxID=2615069 RepID=UPI00361A6877